MIDEGIMENPHVDFSLGCHLWPGVDEGQVVARLDSYDLRTAEVARLEAILTNARSEMARQEDLSRKNLTSEANFDAEQMDLDIALADLAAAKANLELSVVRSPLRAQVLEIHAYPGERVGPEGVAEPDSDY